jgi:sulfite reductase beta subunit-like hemoprotein
MHDGRIETTMEMATELEWIAREVAEALDATVAAGGDHARNAERHLVRLRFSLARVDELKQRVARTGGVFEPARLEVAVSILDLHVMRAEGFCERIAARAPKARRGVTASKTGETRTAIDDAVEYVAERAA